MAQACVFSSLNREFHCAALKHKVTHVHEHDFIKNRFLGMGRNSVIMGWLVSYPILFPDYEFMMACI